MDGTSHEKNRSDHSTIQGGRPKVKVEMVVPSDRSEEVLQALSGAARTGKIGDGKIFVYDVAEAVRIRNGDRGDMAL
jgi:nitrogen regulatory protein P-II 1